MEEVSLGSSGLRVPPLGVGCWSWGDARYWGYGQRIQPGDVVEAYSESIAAGLRFFDTAEVYGHGESEKILGYMLRRSGERAVVATKFAPLPNRGGVRGLRKALELSLKRLGLSRVDLYQVHWCDRDVAPLEPLFTELAAVQREGLVGALGVSNFAAQETREAARVLERHGVPLASHQMHYSLLWREPEADGVLEACRALGVTVLAYSPLAQGLLAGRYLEEVPAQSARAQSALFQPERVEAARALAPLLRELAAQHDATPAQVALRWLLEQPGVVPLPGASTGAQARENAGALRFTLGEEACARLSAATERFRRSER